MSDNDNVSTRTQRLDLPFGVTDQILWPLRLRRRRSNHSQHQSAYRQRSDRGLRCEGRSIWSTPGTEWLYHRLDIVKRWNKLSIMGCLFFLLVRSNREGTG